MTDDGRFQALNDAVQEILRKQIALEARVSQLETALRTVLTTAPSGSVPPGLTTPGPHAAAAPHESSAGRGKNRVAAHRSERPAIETKLGLTLVNRIGVITLTLGVAFFFKWAVDNEWIGPSGRVLLGLLVGCSTVTAADFLFRKTQNTFAQGIAGAGVAILYLAAYAAFGFYHLVPQAVAFALLFGTTALGVALSLRYESPAIAALGLLGGYLTPLLLSTGEDHPWFLVSYVLLLNFSAMSLGRTKSWRVLEVLAFVATTIIYFFWFAQHEADHRKTVVATFGALAYYVLFAYLGSGIVSALSNFVAAVEVLFVWPDVPGPFFVLELLVAASGLCVAWMRKLPVALTVTFASFWLSAGFFSLDSSATSLGARIAGLSLGFLLLFAFAAFSEYAQWEAKTESTMVLATVAANGSVYFGLVYALLRTNYHEWLGFIAVCVAATYLVLAAFTRRRLSLRGSADLRPLLVPIGMAVAFVTLAIAIQLTGFRITVAWALQAAALSWLGMKFTSQLAHIGGAAVFLLAAMRLVLLDARLYSFHSSTPTVLFNPRFLAFSVSAACAFAAVRWIGTSSRRLALAEFVGAHMALLAGLTLELLMWVTRNSAVSNRVSAETFSVSVLYGVYAVVLVGIGVVTRTAVNRLSGLVLIGFVIVKLYLFDVWQLDRAYRIAAFVALGILLISTSFLYSRYRHVLDALLRKDETAA
ncbi:MAG: DUF2339 domain-containing protein [Bryobacteraceae bacterium]